MNIELSAHGKYQVDELNLDDLFEHVVLVDDRINRLRWRINAMARIWGVEPDYVYIQGAEFEGEDVTPSGDALDTYENVVKFYDWAEGKQEDEYLPILAQIVTEDWRYLNYDDLKGEREKLMFVVEDGDYEEFAHRLVDDGLIDGPGEGWDYYVDWESKGEDIANDYTSYELNNDVYLFGG